MVSDRPTAGTFTTRMMAVLFAIVGGVVLLCVAAVLYLTVERVSDQAEEQALSIARTLASDPELRTRVADESGATALDPRELAAGPVQRDAEAVRQRTRALFVVVTNDRGIRLAHPNSAELGRRVSTDPEALRGREAVSRQRGTLGESVRAKVPVRDDGGTVVGEVSVGVAVETLSKQVHQAVVSVLLVGLIAAALAAVATALLVRWLRRTTLGLEPEDMAQLVRDQEAVLYGVDDGVIGIGPDGRISVRNKTARILLDLPHRSDRDDVVGRPYDDVGLPDALVRSIAEQRSGHRSEGIPLRLELPRRTVRARVQSVRRDGTDLGQVVMLRDLSAVEELRSRLTAMQAMAEALRAQRHEFANRLHMISGLLGNGDVAHATSYVEEIIAAGPVRDPVVNIAAVTDPYLRAFIGAKGVQAHERGVVLRVGPETALWGTLTEAQDVTAILGNLVDNALQAALAAQVPHGGDRWVEIDLLSAESTLHLAVADSGDGVPSDLDVFAAGTTTRGRHEADAHGHGVGLGLARRLARLVGGDLWIADPGGSEPGLGAVFAARLPGVLTVTDRPPRTLEGSS